MKICSLCKEEKPVADFYIERRRNKPLSVCKPCGVIKAREYRRANPDFEKNRYAREKESIRERHLVRKYGVTLAEYKSMLDAQGGVCAICKAPESDQYKGVLHVDHCHKTGAVRGLLCRGCNHMLGSANDNPAVFVEAIRYLLPQVAAEFIGAYLEAVA